jgi:aryl-alcohol dehydrogenase-like predicted oxidoreductase
MHHGKWATPLVLGTAQFGSSYGIANRLGRPDTARVSEILDLAYELGLRLLDTASAYGDCETVLGTCGIGHWSVITKVPSFNGVDDKYIGERVRASVLRSLELLGVDSLHGVLAHDSRDMVGDRGKRLRGALEPLRAAGLVDRLGVSVYSPMEMAGIDLERIQIVQAPFNVLDQRFATSGTAAAVRRCGGELHVRSIFLQGLLLMPGAERPARFAPWKPILARYDQRVRESGLNPAAFCLGFAAGQEDVARCVVGVDSPQQLTDLVAAFEAGRKIAVDSDDLGSNELGLIDPRCWEDNKYWSGLES